MVLIFRAEPVALGRLSKKGLLNLSNFEPHAKAVVKLWITMGSLCGC
mgnify:CR=1 FL=1